MKQPVSCEGFQLVFYFREDAKRALRQGREKIKTHGYVTMAELLDFSDICYVIGEPLDNDYGWADLAYASVDCVLQGYRPAYLLRLPAPALILRDPNADKEETSMGNNKGADKGKVGRHQELCMALNELYARKNQDYGDSFHATWKEEGMAMARIRLSDKLSRFKKLSMNGGDAQVKDESIRDTLIDLANYALMTVLEMDDEKKENGK